MRSSLGTFADQKDTARRKRWIQCLVFAAGLHALGGVWSATRPEHPQPRSHSAVSTELVVELEPYETITAREQDGAPTPAPSPPKTPPSPAKVVPGPSAFPEALPDVAHLAPEGQATEEDALQRNAQGQPPSPPAEGGGREGSADERPARRLSLSQLGIGRSPQIAVPRLESELAHKKRTVEERLQRKLAQGLATRDAKMGLGPQGEVRGALLRATQEAQLTSKSSARFRVLLGQGGAVDTVTVLSSTSLGESWNRIARATRKKLASRKLTLPSNVKGAELRFFLEHDFRLPSGKSKGSRQKEPYVKDFSSNFSFDVADIGKDAQPVVRARLENYSVF